MIFKELFRNPFKEQQKKLDKINQEIEIATEKLEITTNLLETTVKLTQVNKGTTADKILRSQLAQYREDLKQIKLKKVE